jgi:hypothetical protein
VIEFAEQRDQRIVLGSSVQVAERGDANLTFSGQLICLYRLIRARQKDARKPMLERHFRHAKRGMNNFGRLDWPNEQTELTQLGLDAVQKFFWVVIAHILFSARLCSL